MSRDGHLVMGDMYECPACLHRHELGGTCVHPAATDYRQNLVREARILADCMIPAMPDYGASRQAAKLLPVLADAIEASVPVEVVALYRTNLDDALEIVGEIDRVRAVIRELRSAFARSELDGGLKALPDHPLHQQAEAKLHELHERLMILV